MKEIKAYFKPEFVDPVVEALENAGAQDLTLSRVDAFGPLADTYTAGHHFVYKYAEKYSALARLELVCRDDQVSRFIDLIRIHAQVDGQGVGRMLITAVEQEVNVRSEKSG